MEHSIYRSSFNPIINAQPQDQRLLEQQCRRVIKQNQKVEIGDIEPQFVSFPYMLRLILSLYYTLSKKLQGIESQAYEYTYFKNPITTHLKYSLLKLLANIIQKKLFVSAESNKLYDELSYALVFKQCLFSLVLSVLSENTNFVAIEKLITFYKNLTSEQHAIFIPIHIYHLYGGGLFTIEAKVFREKLTYLIETLGKTLSSSETVVNRNIESFKGNKERQILLEESIKTVMMSKNKEALAQVVEYITTSIFKGREYLQRQQFQFHLQNQPIEPTLTIFLMLVRAEVLLFQERSFKTNLLLRNEITKTNFYTNQMAKMFNKCPYNGDERCNCKKCQCVRRNRESAKLSQEKKRNAVQQLQNFKKRIEELEERDESQENQIKELEESVQKEAKRSIELEEQNLMLKSLLMEMKANPNIKLLMMQTIQPVSKVLSNDF